MKKIEKYRFSLKKTLIFFSITIIIFVAITFFTAKLLFIKGGLDYYGYPLTFHIDYHSNLDLGYKSTNILPIREQALSNATKIFNFFIDLFLVALFVALLFLLNKLIFARIKSNLGKIPASYFGLTYLIIIPIYALIYFLMPNQFYKNTYNIENISVGYETTKDIQYEITDEIINILTRNFNVHYKNGYILSDNGDTIKCPISSGSMQDYVVTTDGLNLFVPIFISCAPSGTFNYAKVMELKIELGNLNYENSLNQDIFRECWLQETYPKDTIQFGFDINRIFPKQQWSYTQYKYGELRSMHISIPRKLYRKINSFVYGVNGYSFRDDYWSLFYLSTVTITTLGFGDIVPITRTGRLLVSSEAILGVIIIGLFLNALTRRKSKK